MAIRFKENQILILILGIALIYWIFKDKKDNDLILENNYVIGEIIGHNTSGLSESFYVKYQYFINGYRYEKTENYGGKFIDCYKTKKCIGLKYVVYYDKDNPENAFMDFNLSEKELYDRWNDQKGFKQKLDELKTE